MPIDGSSTDLWNDGIPLYAFENLQPIPFAESIEALNGFFGCVEEEGRRQTPIPFVPDEIKLLIFSHLEKSDLDKASLVNHQWRDLLSSQEFIQPKLQEVIEKIQSVNRKKALQMTEEIMCIEKGPGYEERLFEYYSSLQTHLSPNLSKYIEKERFKNEHYFRYLIRSLIALIKNHPKKSIALLALGSSLSLYFGAFAELTSFSSSFFLYAAPMMLVLCKSVLSLLFLAIWFVVFLAMIFSENSLPVEVEGFCNLLVEGLKWIWG